MALNGTGKGSRPVSNSKGRTVKNTKLSSTGGSIAKNNTNFRKGPIGSGGGIPQRSTGEVLTNPQFDKLQNQAAKRPSRLKQTNKLPAGMTQLSTKQVPIGNSSYAQPNRKTTVMRGGNDSTTVSNLKKYLAKKARGETR